MKDWIKIVGLLTLFWAVTSGIIYSQIVEVKNDLKDFRKESRFASDLDTQTSMELAVKIALLENENGDLKERIEKLEEKTERIIP